MSECFLKAGRTGIPGGPLFWQQTLESFWGSLEPHSQQLHQRATAADKLLWSSPWFRKLSNPKPSSDFDWQLQMLCVIAASGFQHRPSESRFPLEECCFHTAPIGPGYLNLSAIRLRVSLSMCRRTQVSFTEYSMIIWRLPFIQDASKAETFFKVI